MKLREAFLRSLADAWERTAGYLEHTARHDDSNDVGRWRELRASARTFRECSRTLRKALRVEPECDGSVAHDPRQLSLFGGRHAA